MVAQECLSDWIPGTYSEVDFLFFFVTVPLLQKGAVVQMEDGLVFVASAFHMVS